MARYDKHVAEGLVHGTTALSSLGGGGGDSLTSDGAVDINSHIGDINFQDGDVNQLALNLDGTAGDIIIKLMVDGDDLVFQQFDGYEVFRLKDNGKVGIGGEPSTTFHVLADDARIRAEATENNHPGFELSEDGTRKWLIYNQPNGGVDTLSFKSTHDRLSITPAGDIVIPTDSSVIKMGVHNDVTFTHDGTTGLEIEANPISMTGWDGVYKKKIVSVEEATDLSSVGGAIAYSGAVFIVEQSEDAAFAITLPTATSTAEATAITGWHISLVLTGAESENITIVRGDISNDYIFGTVVAGDAAASGITIGSHVITFVGDTATLGDRVDITCVVADANNTVYTAQGFCAV